MQQVEPPRNRVLEELRVLDARFEDPKCSHCSGGARLAITSEGVVIACNACEKNERVDTETLQRLADRLRATCYSCEGPLKSTARQYA